jgi:hypothetical protein
MREQYKYPVAERDERLPAFGTHYTPRAQFAKPILVDDEAHEPGFPIGDDWAFEFYRETGGEG